MANNTSCGCMGALNCIAGPLTHCCSSCANSDCYQNFPYYTGPCPPCNCDNTGCSGHRCRKNCGCCNNGSNCGNCGCNYGCNNCNSCTRCGCNNGCSNCNNCGCSHTRYNAGMFSADAPLSVSAGDAIPLYARRNNPNSFDNYGGCIRIARSGLYHVVWTVNLPCDQDFSGRLYLTLNGNEVSGSGQTIYCQADNTSTSATGQAMVQTGPNGILCLNTDYDLDVPAGCCMENIVTLTITRVN